MNAADEVGFAAEAGWRECEPPVEVPGWVCRWFWHEGEGWYGLRAGREDADRRSRLRLRPMLLGRSDSGRYVAELLEAGL